MSLNQRRTSMKTFIESQPGYCPLVWMFHGRIVNKEINHLHEKALPIVYKDYISSFEDYLKEINLALLTIETFSHWLSSYSKLSKILSIQCYVTYFRHYQ